MDYRFFAVQTGVIPHANGSSRLQLDRTEILVSVKAELGEPEPEAPHQGKIVCSVDCTSSLALESEDERKNVNIQLTSGLTKVLCESKWLDLSTLCVIKGKQCWTIYVDAMVLDSSGNLLDAICLAARAALITTTLPRIEVLGQEEGNEGGMEIQVSDDPNDAKPLVSSLLSVPIAVTLTKIGNAFVVDASAEEEQCMAVGLTLVCNEKGEICGMQKMALVESLPPLYSR